MQLSVVAKSSPTPSGQQQQGSALGLLRVLASNDEIFRALAESRKRLELELAEAGLSVEHVVRRDDEEEVLQRGSEEEERRGRGPPSGDPLNERGPSGGEEDHAGAIGAMSTSPPTASPDRGAEGVVVDRSPSPSPPAAGPPPPSRGAEPRHSDSEEEDPFSVDSTTYTSSSEDEEEGDPPRLEELQRLLLPEHDPVHRIALTIGAWTVQYAALSSSAPDLHGPGADRAVAENLVFRGFALNHADSADLFSSFASSLRPLHHPAALRALGRKFGFPDTLRLELLRGGVDMFLTAHGNGWYGTRLHWGDLVGGSAGRGSSRAVRGPGDGGAGEDHDALFQRFFGTRKSQNIQVAVWRVAAGPRSPAGGSGTRKRAPPGCADEEDQSSPKRARLSDPADRRESAFATVGGQGPARGPSISTKSNRPEVEEQEVLFAHERLDNQRKPQYIYADEFMVFVKPKKLAEAAVRRVLAERRVLFLPEGDAAAGSARRGRSSADSSLNAAFAGQLSVGVFFQDGSISQHPAPQDVVRVDDELSGSSDPPSAVVGRRGRPPPRPAGPASSSSRGASCRPASSRDHASLPLSPSMPSLCPGCRSSLGPRSINDVFATRPFDARRARGVLRSLFPAENGDHSQNGDAEDGNHDHVGASTALLAGGLRDDPRPPPLSDQQVLLVLKFLRPALASHRLVFPHLVDLTDKVLQNRSCSYCANCGLGAANWLGDSDLVAGLLPEAGSGNGPLLAGRAASRPASGRDFVLLSQRVAAVGLFPRRDGGSIRGGWGCRFGHLLEMIVSRRKGWRR